MFTKKVFLLFFFALFFPLALSAGALPVAVQTIVPSTSITVNAFVTSQPVYLSPSGNIFKVVEETTDFYLVQLPRGEKGWLQKIHTLPVPPDLIDINHIPTPSLTKIEPKITPKAPAPVVLPPYRFSGQENYRYPIPPKKTNLDLDVTGYYQVKVSARDFSPNKSSDPRYDIIIRDPVYNKIPADVLLGPLKTEFRLNVQIDGKLDENLSVHYDIQQEPYMPDKYDVKIQYKNKELQFYNFDAEYVNGEFLKVKKGINGAQYKQSDANSDFRVSMGRERSDPKTFATFGNGQSKYNLGNTSILEGSVSVWKNNHPLKEGSEYKVNYYEGTVEFTVVPQKTDYLQAVYEFTNPIEDFLPALSRKNFFGVQYLWKAKSVTTEEKKQASAVESLWTTKPPVTASRNSAVAKGLLPQQQTTENRGGVQLLQATPSASIASAIQDMLDDELVTTNALTSTASLMTSPISSPSISVEIIPTKPPQSFFLKNTPIILGTDLIELNDRELIRNTDYFLDHSTGKVSLVCEIATKDTLTAAYDYYLSQKREEDIIGKDSPGPYSLKDRYIIDGTVDVSLNGQPVREIRDYIVDYDSGQLFFNYVIAYPKIISVKYASVQSITVTQNAEKSSFTAGVTYVTEYSRSQEEELTIKVVSENATITGNVLFLANSPLINTANLRIIVSGQTLTSKDYKIENAYKGKISFVNYSSGKASISYSYRKSHPTRITFQGTGLSQYVSGEKFVLRDLPMRFNGIRQVMLWRASGGTAILRPGDDFDVDFGPDGFDIKLTFKKRSDTTNLAQLDRYPEEADTISVDYDFTSQSSTDPGNVEQKMIGLTAGTSISDKFRIDGEVVAANHNFSKPQITLTDPIQLRGTGIDFQVYNLGKANLVENSETVFIGSSAQSNVPTANRTFRNIQTKDRDYIINYTQGTLKFRNKTPGPNDSVIVFFKYYDLSGITQVGEDKTYKYATKFSTTYKGDSVSNQSYFRYIDRNFLPISPIQGTKGTTALGNTFLWTINPKNSFGFNYVRTQEDRGAKDNSTRLYLVSDDFSSQLHTRLFNTFDTDTNFKYSFKLEDPKDSTALTNKHGIDSLGYGWDSAVAFGPTYLRATVKKSFSKDISDYIDQNNPASTEIFSHNYALAFKPSKFPILKKVTFSPMYSNSREMTTTLHAPTLSVTYRQSYGYLTEVQPFNSLKGSAQYTIQNLLIKPSETAPTDKTNLFNSLYSLSYTPAAWFQARWDKNHAENETPLNSQRGSISDSQTYSISKFSPYGALTASGIRHQNPFILPLKDAYFTLSKQDESLDESNNKKHTSRLKDSYSLNAFTPFKGLTLSNYTYSYQNTSLINDVATLTTSGNTSDHRFERQNAALTFVPQLPLLRLFSYQYQFDKANDTQVDRTFATVSTGNLIDQKHPLSKSSQKLSFNPLPIVLPLPFGWKLPLGSFSAAIQDSRDNRTNTTITSLVPFLEGVKIPTPSRQEDSYYEKTLTYEASISPFNLFNLRGSLTSSNVTIRRNLNLDKGSTFKSAKVYNLAGDWSPFRWIVFNGTYTRDNGSQFTSPSLNATQSQVAQAMDNADFKTFQSYLNKLSLSRSLQATFTPFKIISFKGGASLGDTTQTVFSQTQTRATNTIQQRSALAGVILRPWADFSIGYDYKLNQAKDSSNGNSNYSLGYNGITTVAYSPIKRKSFEVTISYNRFDSWGFNLNDLNNRNLAAGTGQIGSTQIVSTDSTEESGVLNVNIAIPIPTSPFLQSFIITGEGYVKKITDRKDGTRESGVLNTLSIGGFVIKGTLNF